MRYSTCFFLFLFFSNYFFAQQNKKVKVLNKEAQLYFDNDDNFKAWQVYKTILKIEPLNERAGVNASMCSFKLGFHVDSIVFLTENLTKNKNTDAKFYLAKIKHAKEQFDDAIILLTDYSKINPKKRYVDHAETHQLLSNCVNAKLQYAKPHRSVIKNIGQQINSNANDYAPVITTDEMSMYFTSRRLGSSNNKKDVYGNFLEDIYLSKKVNNHWTDASNVKSPLNTETNDACVAISADAQRMIIYRASADGVSGDLYLTKIGTDGNWETPVILGKEINSEFVETSACFSSDTSEIYFSSNRPGGFGGKDIYRVKRMWNGRWAMPFNLGPTINTMFDEDAPFLHPDGQTLFFSSKGHVNIGEYDVFKTVLDKDSNTFSVPDNLGYPINSVGNDIFFTLNPSGLKAYYSSNKEDSYGLNDIYEIDTRFGDNDIVVKHGLAYKDSALGKVKITLVDTDNNQITGVYNSNPKTGTFILVLNPLKNYRAIVESEGYKSMVVDIDAVAFEKIDKDLEFKLEK